MLRNYVVDGSNTAIDRRIVKKKEKNRNFMKMDFIIQVLFLIYSTMWLLV